MITREQAAQIRIAQALSDVEQAQRKLEHACREGFAKRQGLETRIVRRAK